MLGRGVTYNLNLGVLVYVALFLNDGVTDTAMVDTAEWLLCNLRRVEEAPPKLEMI